MCIYDQIVNLSIVKKGINIFFGKWVIRERADAR